MFSKIADMLTDTWANSFGWVNASYVYGLQILDTQMRRALGALASWDDFQRKVAEADAHQTGRL